MRPLGARGFSSKIEYTEEYLQKQQATTKKGKFFEFIKKIDKLDATPTTPKPATADYDISELDISFDKISRTQDLTSNTA